MWDAGALLTGNASAQPAVPARDPSDRRIFTLSAAGIGPNEDRFLEALEGVSPSLARAA